MLIQKGIGTLEVKTLILLFETLMDTSADSLHKLVQETLTTSSGIYQSATRIGSDLF